MGTPAPIEMELTTHPKRLRPRVTIRFKKPSLTDQSFKDECDINLIMEKVLKGHPVSHINTNEAFYGDVSEIPDFTTATQMILDADNAFMALPAKIREQFKNDPAEFIEFCQNPDNNEALIKMGLHNQVLKTDDLKPSPPTVDTPSVPLKTEKPAEE